MKIEYQNVPIAQIIEYFVKGFKPENGEKIGQYEHFYDPQKGIVILKLFISESKSDAE